MENNEVKKKSKKKIVKVILLIVLVVVLIILSPLLFLVGSIFSEMIFNKPSTPEIKHAEVPFVLVYEDNGETKKIEDTFVVREEKGQQCITIAASTIPAQYLLPEILASYNEKYPNQQFKIVESDSTKVVEQVVNHTVNIGFTGTVIDKRLCKYIPFYQDELVVITPNTEKYRKLLEEEQDAKWIVNESLIMREEGSGTRKEAEKQLKKIGLHPGKLNVMASMENPEAIKRAVSNGMGISLISRLAAEDEIQKGTLLAHPISSEDMRRDINVIYNRNLQLSRSSERFIKVVKELYKKERNA